jgi:hypothetical protein
LEEIDGPPFWERLVSILECRVSSPAKEITDMQIVANSTKTTADTGSITTRSRSTVTTEHGLSIVRSDSGRQGDSGQGDDGLTGRMMRLFAGLEDRHGRYVLSGKVNADGKAEGEGKNLPGGPTPEMWRDHLAGKERLGVIPIRRDGTVVWGCVDIDSKEKPDHVAIVRARSAHDHYLPAIICRSKSGNAAHVYMFASEPVPAPKMRARLREAARIIGHPGAEIFPVQDQLDPGACGNYVNMPFFGDTCLMVTGGKEDAGLEDFLNCAEACQMDQAWFDQPIEGAPETGDSNQKEYLRYELPDVIPECDNAYKAVAVRMRRFFGCTEPEIHALLAGMDANTVRMAVPKKGAAERISKSIAPIKPGDKAAERLPAQIIINRSDKLIELARSLYTWNHTESEIAATLAAVNKQRCGDQPLSADEIGNIAHRAVKMKKRSGACIANDSDSKQINLLSQ